MESQMTPQFAVLLVILFVCDLNADGLQMMTALAIGLFFVVIGVPLWWKTTTTYRAYLPHSDIHELAHKEVSLDPKCSCKAGDVFPFPLPWTKMLDPFL